MARPVSKEINKVFPQDECYFCEHGVELSHGLMRCFNPSDKVIFCEQAISNSYPTSFDPAEKETLCDNFTLREELESNGVFVTRR